MTTTFTRNAMDAAAQAVREQKPKGLKGLHIGVASVDPRTGALKGFYGGQDYLKSQINYATRAAGSPGSAFKPFALAAGIDDGYSLTSTFDGNSPYVFPNGRDKVVNEGPGDGNDYGSAISLTKATEESVNTAFVDLTQSMENGPQKILDMAVKMGVPSSAPGLEPVAGISLGSATISPVDMANSYGTIADGGKAKKWYVINKVTSAGGEGAVQGPEADQAGAVRGHRPATSASRCSRSSRTAPGRTPWRWAARPPARPAPRPTPTATSPRPGSSATPRSWRPR